MGQGSPETNNLEALTGNEPDIALSTRLYNEAYVLGTGIVGSASGIKEAAVKAYENPGSAAVQVGISTVFGLGVGYFSARAGLGGLVARGAMAAAGLAFVDEGIKPWRDAMSSAWNARDDQDLTAASQKFSNKLGHFVFDTALMTPGAVGGTIAGARLTLALGERVRLPGLATKESALASKTHALGDATIVAGTDLAGAKVLAGEAVVAETGIAAEVAAGATTPAVRRKPYRFEFIEPGQKTHKLFDVAVEITDPHQISRRVKLNLDHHRATDTHHTLSAAEQALLVPDNKLPEPGSVFGTNRVDADSITAMAVIANRFEGRPVNRRLVEAIGRRDRGLKEPPPGENYSDLNDMIDAVQFNARSDRDLFKKVYFVKDVLDGTVNQELLLTLAQRSRSSRRNLHEQIEETMKVDAVVPGRLAFVESFSSGALNHGYDYAPVVVLRNTNRHFTRYSIGIDPNGGEGKYLGRALLELQKLEPGWGGRGTIFGSPQEANTKLTPEQVLEVVKRYLDPPAHKRLWWDTVDYLRDTRPAKWLMGDATSPIYAVSSKSPAARRAISESGIPASKRAS